MPNNTIDLNRSCGDASTNIKVRVQKMRNNMKTGLDDAGSALMARVRSGSRSPKYSENTGSFLDKPVWDKHHANCTHQDNTKLLNQEVHARMLQNVKLKDDRDKLKKKIIDLRQELLKVKEKFWRK